MKTYIVLEDGELAEVRQGPKRSTTWITALVVTLFIMLALKVSANSSVSPDVEFKNPRPYHPEVEAVEVIAPEEIAVEAPVVPDHSELTDDHILWSARLSYSETKHPVQAKYVMEIAMNRWRTQYMDKETLWGTIHHPYAFSAFNSADLRARYGSLTWGTNNELWQETLDIAREVVSEDYQQVLALDCRHFYHTIIDEPKWAKGVRPTMIIPDDGPQGADMKIYCGVR